MVEIRSYSQVWFMGSRSSGGNFGDDRWNFYKAVVNDHIGYRYEILELMGEGAFAQVAKCWDHKEKEFVAIKVIRNIPSARSMAMEEVWILRNLLRADESNTHNIVRMRDDFNFRGHLCIVFELLGDDLNAVLRKRGFMGWSQEKVRSTGVSLLKCFQLLKQEGIVHCDLKPENIVMSADGGVKVIDFGLAYDQLFGVCESHGTQYYQAPELALGNWSACTTAIDMWSLGCTLAELSTGRLLFCGRKKVDQMTRIMEVLGVPPRELLMGASLRGMYFDSSGQPLYAPLKAGSKPLSGILKDHDPNFVDFVMRCLMWDPAYRITPDEAMQHPWIARGYTNQPRFGGLTARKKQQTLPCKTFIKPPAAAPKPPPLKEKTASAQRLRHLAKVQQLRGSNEKSVRLPVPGLVDRAIHPKPPEQGRPKARAAHRLPPRAPAAFEPGQRRPGLLPNNFHMTRGAAPKPPSLKEKMASAQRLRHLAKVQQLRGSNEKSVRLPLPGLVDRAIHPKPPEQGRPKARAAHRLPPRAPAAFEPVQSMPGLLPNKFHMTRGAAPTPERPENLRQMMEAGEPPLPCLGLPLPFP